MRGLVLASLLLAGLVPGSAQAACSGSTIILGETPNQVWVSEWRCDEEPDERVHHAHVTTFWPFSTTDSRQLVAATSGSKVQHGEGDAYTRTDTLVVDAAGVRADARLTTKEDTNARTTCALWLTVANAGVRNAPLPACVPGDRVLL